jgi:hypothetical protein
VLSEVSGPISQSKDQLPPGTGQLLTKAKDIYRAGQKCMKEGDRLRAGELGKAANEAGRGLKHVLRASLSPAADLPPPDGTDAPPPQRREGRRAKGPARDDGDGPPPPPRQGPRGKGRHFEDEEDAPPAPPRNGRQPNGPPPPPDGADAFESAASEDIGAQGPPPRIGEEEEDGPPPPPRRAGRLDKGPPPAPPDDGPGTAAEPWQHARAILRHVRERLDEADSETGAGKAFLDGARNVYGLARRAYLDGDYRKATEFGCAAEAWTHVGEHLTRAGYEAAELKTRRDAAPRPPPEGRRGNRPPPPPPGEDGDDRGPGAWPGRDSGPPPPPDGRRRPPSGDGGPSGRRPAPPPPPEE